MPDLKVTSSHEEPVAKWPCPLAGGEMKQGNDDLSSPSSMMATTPPLGCDVEVLEESGMGAVLTGLGDFSVRLEAYEGGGSCNARQHPAAEEYGS